VPSGLIEEQDGVSAGRDLAGDFVDVQLHGAGVAGGQDHRRADAPLGADGAEQIGRLGALVVIEAGVPPFTSSRVAKSNR